MSPCTSMNNMTRLQSYILNESQSIESIIETIQRDCNYYIKMIRMLIGPTPMYRGYKSNEVFLKKIPHINRKPKDTPIGIHKYIDEWFYKKFGWRPRSEGVFTSSSPYLLTLYGNEYLFFPAGDKLKFIYSPTIGDLMVDIDILFSNGNYDLKVKGIEDVDLSNPKHKNLLDELLTSANYLQNRNLPFMFKGKEVIWKCQYYYLVNSTYIENKYGTADFMMKVKDI